MNDPVLYKNRKTNHSDKKQQENQLRGGVGSDGDSRVSSVHRFPGKNDSDRELPSRGSL